MNKRRRGNLLGMRARLSDRRLGGKIDWNNPVKGGSEKTRDEYDEVR